ncbi:uncharacterized protein LOC134542291 [Bacillus rossius redtenbacheri]|uniref:uncharacterized protein LOC134542291 n=1 Tax=Bacillus rossius redtenbacheri TaxID=93214 RepID=UPI002FDE4634
MYPAARQVLLLAVLLCAVSSLARPADDLGAVVFASVLFRHGDRAPTGSYPNDPYNDVARYWPRGYGQLSEIGEEQHYRLGSYLRQRYSDLLPLTYNYNDTHIRSTDVDRTLVSARCNLEGLYPPTEKTLSQPSIKFQAIPIHTETQSNDDLLLPFDNCAKYTSLVSLLKQSREYQCVMETTADVQREVSAHAGYTTFDAGIADVLFIEDLYNLKLPDWVTPYYPTPLRNLYLLENYIVNAGTTELQRYAAGPMLKEIIENMQAKVNATLSPDRSLYIYSAHDDNVVNTLQALKVFNGILVPYASTVLIELREKSGSFYVTVSYKNSTETEPYLLQLPGCDSLCPLDQFVELTKEVIPDDLDTECAEEAEEGKEYQFEVPANAILPEWEHCFEKPKTQNEQFHVMSFIVPAKRISYKTARRPRSHCHVSQQQRTVAPAREMTTTTTMMLRALVLTVAAAAVDSRSLSASDRGLGQIVFASVVFRHGDRAPEVPYPNDPYKDDVKYWPRGFGQLTPIGEEQHLRLGTFLRRRYAHMLPLAYNTNDTYVRSTDVDRTLVSARCNLAGLYPDVPKIPRGGASAVNFQAIPIHTEMQPHDWLLKTYEICPRHAVLLAQLKQSREFQCVVKATADLRREVPKHTGQREFASDIFDTLLVQETHNMPLPDWASSYYPTPLKHLHLLENFIAISGTSELQRLSAGPILRKMAEDMLDKADGVLTPDRSLFVYSAHDNNVVNILQSLKVFNGLLAPYASAVLVELREKNRNYYVTVSYRNSSQGDAHLLQLPGCDTLCPLDEFVRLVQPVIPDDIEAECAEEVVGVPEQDLQVPAAAIPAEWKHCFEKSRSGSENGRYVNVPYQ